MLPFVKDTLIPADFYMKRVLACKLLPKLYKKFPEALKLFESLCSDPHDKVRQTCALNLH